MVVGQITRSKQIRKKAEKFYVREEFFKSYRLTFWTAAFARAAPLVYFRLLSFFVFFSSAVLELFAELSHYRPLQVLLPY